jgi:hypothetical protein
MKQSPASHAALLAFAVLVASRAAGQPTAEPALRMEISNLAETRSTGPLGNLISFDLYPVAGPILAQTRVQNLTVTRAVDNLGRTLSWSPVIRRVMPSATPRPVFVTLTGLSRLSREFSIEGTVELATPTEENGGLVRIPGVRNHAGRLELPGLAQAGVGIEFVKDPETWNEARTRVPGAAGSWGRSTIATTRAPASGTVRGGYTFSSATWPAWNDPSRYAGLIIDDPGGRFIAAWLQDGAGRVISTPATSPATLSGARSIPLLLDLSSPLADDTELILTVAAPASVRTMPFRLEKIPLY